MNSYNSDIFVLGSGISILNLKEKETDYINSCKLSIAINKFMAFHKMIGIHPTHVYFVDDYDISNVLFLQYIFDVCKEDQLSGITFILNKKSKKRLASDPTTFYLKKLAIRLLRKGRVTLFRVPGNCKYDFITHYDWLSGGPWSDSLEKPLFHYRGSLSTVLNYVSIKYPNKRIKLVGVDFNSPGYFFEDELNKLDFKWQDWTTEIVRKKGRHFSAIEYKGTTVFDKFDYIVEMLNKTGNTLYSCNANSLLVDKGYVAYLPVME